MAGTAKLARFTSTRPDPVRIGGVQLPFEMTGDRAGLYSLSITGNWRISFHHDAETGELYDMDYEDYHRGSVMAIKANFDPAHVGGFIKDMIIPDGMTVTATARLLGVDRPALSQLLNENASLSPEMALRIEKVIGVRMDTLLNMPARYDTWQIRQREHELKLDRYRKA